jgi:hypothetical protein
MSGLPDFVVPGVDSRDLTIPRFYIRPLQNAFKTAQEGRPIFDDVEYVEVIIPGDRNAVVDERVKDEHRQRWPRQYQNFKDGREMAQDGTPLEEWPGVTRSQVEELKHFNVRTVEVLAALDDSGLQRAVPMGGYALRDKAKRFLELAAGSAPADALAAERERDRATMEAMKEQMAAMAAEIDRLRAASSGGAQ